MSDQLLKRLPSTKARAGRMLLCITFLVLHCRSGVSQCMRTVEDKSQTPNFICEVDVTVVRRANCQLFITERFLFPHTTEDSLFRDIPQLDDLQTVSDVKIFRDGSPMPIISGPANDNTARVDLPTLNSEEPVQFTVSYSLSNGVMRFTDTCGGNGDEDPNKNVMRWRSGDWSQSFDMLRVTFTTSSERAKLELLFGEKPVAESNERQVIVEKKDVNKNTEIYVAETGERLCMEKTKCFEGRGVSILGIVLITLALVFTVCCFAAACWSMRKRTDRQNEVVGSEKMSEA